MPTSKPLPAQFPDGTKYVIEGRGPLVCRHIEYPDGSRVELPPRKAQSCACIEARKSGHIAAETPRRRVRKPARTAA